MRLVTWFTFAAGLLPAVALYACAPDLGPTLPPEAIVKKTEVPKFAIPPQPWIDPAPIQGVTVELDAPKKIAADAAVIQMKIALENRSTNLVSLGAPTPCAIHNWRLIDSAGKEVMHKRAEMCEQVVQSHALQPGQVIEQTVFIPLEPNVLQSGVSYRLQYEFWAQPATLSFTAE